MPPIKKELLSLAYQYAEKLGVDHRFNKDKKEAGKYFSRLHEEIPRYLIEDCRSKKLIEGTGFNKEQADRLFDKLTDLIDKFNFSSSKIFTADETGITSYRFIHSVHTDRLRVMSIRGKKQVGKLTSAELGGNVTVLLAVDASGDNFIPPLFFFPHVPIDRVKKDAPEGSIFYGRPIDWITKDNSLKWLELLAERINPTAISPALLILDGHSSQKNLDMITFDKHHFIHTETE